MLTKTYDGQSGKLVAAIATSIPKTLSGSRMQYWIDNPPKLQKFLYGLLDSERTGGVENDLYILTATTPLAAVPAKSQSECFVGDHWNRNGKDADFDVGRYFKKDQPASGVCTISTVALKKQWRFMQFAITVLGDEWKGKSVKELGNEIIRRGLTLINAQAEAMVELTEGDTPTGMMTNGYGNFYFTETGDEENPVAVGFVGRDDRLWIACIRRLDYSLVWDAGRRFLLRNLEVPSTL